jgi:hypothetical protein
LEAILLAVWGSISLPEIAVVMKNTEDNEIIEKCDWGTHGLAFLIVQVTYLVSTTRRVMGL